MNFNATEEGLLRFLLLLGIAPTEEALWLDEDDLVGLEIRLVLLAKKLVRRPL